MGKGIRPTSSLFFLSFVLFFLEQLLVGMKRKRISGLGTMRKKRKSSITSGFKPPTMKKPEKNLKKINSSK